MANLTWVGFIEFIVDRLTSEYQQLPEGMNFIQMRHTGSVKAYMCDFNGQINLLPKMDKFA